MHLSWRGFELHPEIPVGGIDANRMWPEAVRRAYHVRLKQRADELGLPFQELTDHIPNTRAALAVSEWARAQGEDALLAFRERAMNAWWARGEDIESPTVLRRLAEAAGLDGDAAVAASTDEAWLARVWAMRDEAAERSVTAIPTVLIGEQRVIGCQTWETFALVAERAGARRR